MRYIILFLFATLISCSEHKELSNGSFNIRTAKSFKFNGLRTEIQLDREAFPTGKPITGRLYLREDQMFKDIAAELKLNYSKTFYYYPKANLDNRIRIGQDQDTLNFEIYSNSPLKSDTTIEEAFGITANFSNFTQSYDTTFITSVEIRWD